MSKETPTIRCAVYTRKSTDENLSLEFNSLDAQREAAESYIASQKSQGWVCLDQHYDDGGFSGGTIERPAFQQLMADVEAGQIDCIVVYKIDRLSRSLMDFARIMETFERKDVSLVSVTQQFNTTSSMGRLTLNILLSFAQFEREIISERTRDKIAAARRKGKWTGGAPVLGYDREKDARGSRLLVNEAEGKQVRAIYRMYLEAGSMLPTLKVIKKRGWVTKRYQTTEGQWRGGREFDKSALQKMLTNVTYLGKVTYKGEVFDGEHEAILDEDLFGQVQGLLRRNRNSGGRYVRNKYGALLKGLVRCRHCGCAMSHHFATRGDRRYPAGMSMVSHAVGELLQWLEGHGVDEDTLVHLEWLWMAVLEHDPRGLVVLQRRLSTDPELFVDLLKLVFRAEGEEPTDVTANQQAVAEQARRLLRGWSVVPGTERVNDGKGDDTTVSVNQDALRQWIAKARNLAGDCGRLSVCEEQIGEVLAHAPRNEDGAWPCEAVRNVIEEVSSPQLDRGFHIAEMNKRGVHFRAPGGDQERTLAAKYKDYRDRVIDRWPRTGAILDGIRQSYEGQAKWHDERDAFAEFAD